MILIVNVCKEDLHYLEFVKPLEEIVKSMSKKFVTKSYLKITSKDLSNCSSVIICGTSLKDFDYTKNLNRFEWLKDFEKPVLGICAGMQIIGLIFDGKIKKKTEIGFYFETLKEEFLGLNGKQEVYHLHNNFIDFEKLKEFKVFSINQGVSQAVKHKEKNIFGVLFHPEVRQKNLISNFLKLL